MTQFIRKFFGIAKKNPKEKDDFSYFFIDAKAREKAKVIKEVMREATAEQASLMEKYRLNKLEMHSR